MLAAVNKLKELSTGANEAISGTLNTMTSEYITAQVDRTKGAVKAGRAFFKKCITTVDKAAPIKSATTVVMLGLKKQNIAMPERVPLKPYNPF